MTRQTVLSRALGALFPARCVGCNAIGDLLCEPCLDATPRAGGQRCTRCWQTGREEACLPCYLHPPAFTAVRSAFAYTGAARRAVLALKFSGLSAMAPRLGEVLSATLREWSPPVDAVVPVPLSTWRRRTRGYDQAELIAREVAREAGLPLDTRCLKRRHTPPQARQHDAAARRENVREAFRPGPRPPARRVLLVDDLATTGATLDACARILLAGGAEAVYGLTFARADEGSL